MLQRVCIYAINSHRKEKKKKKDQRACGMIITHEDGLFVVQNVYSKCIIVRRRRRRGRGLKGS